MGFINMYLLKILLFFVSYICILDAKPIKFDGDYYLKIVKYDENTINNLKFITSFAKHDSDHWSKRNAQEDLLTYVIVIPKKEYIQNSKKHVRLFYVLKDKNGKILTRMPLNKSTKHNNIIVASMKAHSSLESKSYIAIGEDDWVLKSNTTVLHIIPLKIIPFRTKKEL